MYLITLFEGTPCTYLEVMPLMAKALAPRSKAIEGGCAKRKWNLPAHQEVK